MAGEDAPQRLAALVARRRQALEPQLAAEARRMADALAGMGACLVVLFGSQARGERPHLTSDVDLLAVMESNAPFIERVADAYRILQPTVAADILIYTPSEFARMKDISSLVKTALTEGRILHDTRNR
jgi:predicted nucleotidyltransferase